MSNLLNEIGRYSAIFISLILLHAVLGKKASFPFGIIVGLTPVFIGIIVIIYDLALMVVVRMIFENSSRITWLERLRKKLFADHDKLRKSKWLKFCQNLGRLGVFIITAVPFSGGLWTGSILAHILNLQRKETYILVGLGSILGCAIFVVSFMGIVKLVNI